MAAVIKGIVEEGDSSVYFGSTLSLEYWEDKAREYGFLGVDGEVTGSGMKLYEG